MWLGGNGLSSGTFGHGAGHSGVFRVDPQHDLVIVVTSAGTRKTFAAHYGEFFKAIIDGLEQEPKAAAQPEASRP